MASDGLVTLAGATIAASAGGVAAWVAARLNRSQSSAQTDGIVATTYAQLVSDLRAELDRRERECSDAIAAVDARCSHRIELLEVEVVRLGGDPHRLS